MKLTGEDLELFLKCCEEAGAKVTPVKPGEKGKITINGEPVNIKELLDEAFPGKSPAEGTEETK